MLGNDFSGIYNLETCLVVEMIFFFIQPVINFNEEMFNQQTLYNGCHWSEKSGIHSKRAYLYMINDNIGLKKSIYIFDKDLIEFIKYIDKRAN